jgi:integrase
VRQLVIKFSEGSSDAQGWSEKTLSDFLSTSKNWVYPLMGDKLAHLVTADDFYRVLSQLVPVKGATQAPQEDEAEEDGTDSKAKKPTLWRVRNVTAKTLRQRYERMFSYARKQGYRRTDDESNPAAWQHFDHRLAKPRAIHAPKARPNVKPKRLPEIYRDLAALAENSLARQALMLKVLTVPRTSSLLKAKWQEFDFEEATWTIPGERMKGDLQRKQDDFVIPLSTAALEVLKSLRTYRTRKGFLFPASHRKNKAGHLGLDAMYNLTVRLGYKGVFTPHGVRHTFSTWRADVSPFASELAEACLAHANGEGNKVAGIYNRGDYLEKRRDVMEAWGKWVTTPTTPAQVVDMAAEKQARTGKAA